MDRQLDEFERVWNEGSSPPEIAEYLPETDDPDRNTMLRELIKIDLEYRWQFRATGPHEKVRRRGIESYLEEFPELGSSHNCPIDLIVHEIRVRRWNNDPFSEAQYRHRFGEQSDRAFALCETLEESRQRNNPGDEATLAGSETGDAARHSKTGFKDERIGDYVILGVIASGGMGVVYRARQAKLNRVVALKMIKSRQFADHDEVRRFHAEAEAVAALDHPNIVPIYEVGEHEGLHFFSMGFVNGTSLNEKLADGPIAPREAAELVETIAAAVQYAHEKGIVHRDLKPANVLIDENGQPKVTDFGLAKITESDSSLTVTGQVMGTPSYMPPEQASGRMSEVGPPADLYSLGAVLYALLTGRPPFLGQTALDTLKLVRETDPVRPSSLQPETPKDLETICLKCLEKDPKRRYESSGALADDLHRFLNHEPITAKPVSSVERLRKFAYRRPALTALSASLALAVVGGLAGTLLALASAKVSERAAVEQEGIAKRNEQEAKSNLKLAQQREATLKVREGELRKALSGEKKARDAITGENYFNTILLAEKRIQDQEYEAAAALLQTCPIELRGWEWRRLIDLALPDSIILRGHANPEFKAGNPTTAVAFSPDGNVLVSGAMDGSVVIWNLRTKQPRRIIRIPNRFVWSLAVDRAGTTLATFTSFGGLRLWNLKNGRNTLILPIVKNRLNMRSEVVFSPDGRHIFVATQDDGIKQFDCKTGLVVREFAGGAAANGHVSKVLALAISSDGKRLLTGSADKTARLWDINTGKVLNTFSDHGATVTALGFGPEPNQVFTGSADRFVRYWNMETGKPLMKFKGANSAIFRARFSRKSGVLAALGMKGRVHLFEAKTGKRISELKGNLGVSMGLSLNEAGTQVAATGTDGSIRVWNIDRGGDKNIAVTHDGPITATAFSDGQKLLTLGTDQKVRILDIGTREVTTLDVSSAESAMSLAVPLDGRFFAVNAPQSIEIRDSTTGKILQSLKDTRNFVLLSVSRSGRWLLASRSSTNESVLWDLRSGKRIHELKGRAPTAGGIAFSPDEKQCLTLTDDDSVLIWDVATGKSIRRLTGFRSAISCASYSADGKRIAVATGSGQLSVWNAQTGAKRLEFEANGIGVVRVSFHPHEPRILTADMYGSVKLWDEKSGHEVMTVRGSDESPAVSAAFSPDGRAVSLITSGIRDGKPQGRLVLLKTHERPDTPETKTK